MALSKRLEAVYVELKRTDIVRGGDPNPGNRQQLLDRLNAVVPYTPEEKAAYMAIRQLSTGHDDEFIAFLSAADKLYWVLAADASAISKALGIEGRVTIYWNASAGKFGISGDNAAGLKKKTKYEPKNPHAKRGQPRDDKKKTGDYQRRDPYRDVEEYPDSEDGNDAKMAARAQTFTTPARAQAPAKPQDASPMRAPALVRPAVAVRPAPAKPKVEAKSASDESNTANTANNTTADTVKKAKVAAKTPARVAVRDKTQKNEAADPTSRNWGDIAEDEEAAKKKKNNAITSESPPIPPLTGAKIKAKQSS